MALSLVSGSPTLGIVLTLHVRSVTVKFWTAKTSECYKLLQEIITDIYTENLRKIHVGTWPCSQKPTTDSCLEPDEFSSHIHSHARNVYKPTLILNSILHLFPRIPL